MKRITIYDQLFTLVKAYHYEVKEARKLCSTNKNLAKRKYARAGIIALQIQAMQFCN